MKKKRYWKLPPTVINPEMWREQLKNKKVDQEVDTVKKWSIRLKKWDLCGACPWGWGLPRQRLALNIIKKFNPEAKLYLAEHWPEQV